MARPKCFAVCQNSETASFPLAAALFLREENITLMRNSGTVIWIKRDPKRILQSPRIRKRPLLANDVNAIYPIWEQRQPLYKKACHFVVYNDGDRENTVQELLKILR